ncbi:MAG: tetratricopeptide repeat protein [Pseudomonadota bacterium]
MKPFAPILALALVTLPAVAQDTPLDMAQITAAFEAGDLETARAGLAAIMQAEPSPTAEFRFGRMLLEGMGGPADTEQGLTRIQNAATGGHLPALTYLGRLAMTGAAKDPALAVRYFQQAAALGHAEAKHLLGLMYKDGRGVEQNLDLAATWLGAAAVEGHGPAMYQLTLLPGTPPETAARWLQEAAAAGVPEAQFDVAVSLQRSGDDIDSVVTLLTRAAARGFTPAQRMLGTLYLTGATGLAQDAKLAEAWLQQAVRGQDLTAALNLGLAYLSGSVIPQDLEQARNFLEIASDNGAHQGSFALGAAFEAGRYADADMVGAVDYYKLAVGQGSDRAAARLGQMTLDESPAADAAPHEAAQWVMAHFTATGDDAAFAWLDSHARDGVTPAQALLGQWLLDQSTPAPDALPFLTAAATAGHVPSQFRLGRALTTGAVGDLDYTAAHVWLNIAAASGHEKAAEMRDTITDLMTTDDIATAQATARAHFDAMRDAPPIGGIKMD